MAEFDLVIRRGRVVNGTGEAPAVQDVAVLDGLIVEVGEFSGSGDVEIDADGAVVAPGFVDIHTHYDGQATWDERLQPSSWHGVTTVVMGNCGVGFAPARPADRTRLVELMSGVEDIPEVALTEGLTWEWETFPEFLDALERIPHDVDLATQVPHAALRVWVMGERAAAYEHATEEEIALMAGLAAEAIRAGALGFTTSRTLNHKSVSGELTPSYEASFDELTAIAAAVGATGAGVLQLVTDWEEDPSSDFSLIRQMMAASGRPMSIAVAQNTANPERFKKVLQFLTDMNAAGYELRGQTPARAIGMIQGLQCTLHPFMTNPVWKKISHLSVAEQAGVMAESGFKARLLAAHTAEKDPHLVGGIFIDRYDGMFELGDPPNYEPHPDTSMASRAAALGCTPEELCYDILVSGEGRGMIYTPISNYAYGSLDAVREMIAHDHTVPGLSDGGAHVGTICDASFPSFLLQYWARDRDSDGFDLSYVIAQQTSATARAVGLHDRGYVLPGYRADINVIDVDRLHLHKPEMHHDLPAGGKRLLQRVDGYRHTFVNGVETYRDGEATGALPGRLIRGGQNR